MKKAIIILSLLFAANASASDDVRYVVCDIGMNIMYHGKPNHLNLLNVRGRLVGREDGLDTWVVNFSGNLPEEYTYLEGPELHINSNLCVYEKLPKRLN